MRTVAFIEDEEVIKKILMHLGLQEITARLPPTATGKIQDYHLDDFTSQLPASDKWVDVDREYPEAYTCWFFEKGAWVWGIILTRFPDFPFSRQDQATDSLSYHPRPLCTEQTFSDMYLAPQHHEVDFRLTQSGKSRISIYGKRKLLEIKGKRTIDIGF